eukprot:TRINITY_DN73_c0_g2_i2.p1 TRINITY_DN73_c0_g2~~TRINITY_DN73_c0_g2_i2.p1  ORF type:complete len:180 (-),score=9.16 TRINITY_DN73_c0_g2_i2:377-916(-)
MILQKEMQKALQGRAPKLFRMHGSHLSTDVEDLCGEKIPRARHGNDLSNTSCLVKTLNTSMCTNCQCGKLLQTTAQRGVVKARRNLKKEKRIKDFKKRKRKKKKKNINKFTLHSEQRTLTEYSRMNCMVHTCLSMCDFCAARRAGSLQQAKKSPSMRRCNNAHQPINSVDDNVVKGKKN